MPRPRCATGSRSTRSATCGGEGGVEIACWLAAVQRERGDLAGARRELEAVREPGDASQAARYWLDSHAELLLAEERFEEALAVAPRRGARFAR